MFMNRFQLVLFAVITLMMALMSILKQSSPWWLGSTCMFMEPWMRTASMRVRYTMASGYCGLMVIGESITAISSVNCWVDLFKLRIDYSLKSVQRALLLFHWKGVISLKSMSSQSSNVVKFFYSVHSKLHNIIYTLFVIMRGFVKILYTE